MASVFLSLALFKWGGAGAGAVVGFCGPGGAWDVTAMGCIGVKITWGVDG